jgi:hypothetical protein
MQSICGERNTMNFPIHVAAVGFPIVAAMSARKRSS